VREPDDLCDNPGSLDALRSDPVFTTRPELRGTVGMVASTHWLASATGMSVLESGGNAFDAAVAAGLVLQVVEPHLNGPGGEVPIILYSSTREQVLVVNGQGPVPAAATVGHFRDLGLELVPGTGLLPACVPGAFDAWMLLLRDFGTLSLRSVMEPALGYALGGYPVVERIGQAVREVEELFRNQWPSSAEIYLRDGGFPAAGRLFSNPTLAATYGRLLAEAEGASRDREGQIEAARHCFYRGFIADAIAKFVQREEVADDSGRQHRGLMVGDDMALYEAQIEQPVSFDYHGHTVFKTGPWGQGPVFLQQLSLLAGFDLDDLEPDGAEFVHTVVESAKLAFADREAHYGDPGFTDVPLAALLDEGYAAARRSLIGPNASLELRPGSVNGRAPRLPDLIELSMPSNQPGWGEPTRARDTCHVDVVDREGNLVSATPSGGWLQSSPCIPHLGFPLGTRAQMFWLQESLPNSLLPGKRPRTTLTPSVAFKRGRPYLAFGTPGGDQQDQWSLVFFLNHVHFGRDLQASIDAPMFHTEHFPSSFFPRKAQPGSLFVESRFETLVLDQLRQRGHDVRIEGPWSLGRVSAAGRDSAGVLKAGANPRGMQGYAVGR
jgi:gamma-glutamyltranspeptidase/glutathione hydrolase